MPDSTSAQIISKLNKEQYQAKVKLLNEFFERFNGREKRTDIDSALSSRKTNVMLLFDLSQFKSKSDPGFLLVDSFAQRVVDDSVTLHYSDANWYAKVQCNGKLNGKAVKFSLRLSVEKRGRDMYKWVISDAEGSIFHVQPSGDEGQLYILPNDHEQFFMSLSKITTETHELIDDYVRSDYGTDALSVFLSLVRSGQLSIGFVADVEFTFYQVPGFVFTVKHFERESLNAGWLISSLRQCSKNKNEDEED